MTHRRRRSSVSTPAPANQGPSPAGSTSVIGLPPRAPGDRMSALWLGVVLALTLAAAVSITFRPVVDHAFLNWDDPDVVAANPRLQQPPGPLVVWAFSTREMGHYQPLSWLALAAVGGGRESARQVHALALALHTLNAVLLLGLITLVLDRGTRGPDRWWVALAATALFGLRVTASRKARAASSC